MVIITCPVPGCGYSTPDVSEAIACVLLPAHATVHNSTNISATASHARGPKLDRPKVDMGITPEEWNVFSRRWNAFVIGSGIDPNNCSSQLFQCACPALGDSLLKSNPTIISRSTSEVMAAMKLLAVVVVAPGVARAELMSMRQLRDEPFRAFTSRVRGKAETCAYVTKCQCTADVDFTDCLVKDVLLAGIADTDIRREVLGMPSILDQSVNDIISFVESREMARNAMPASNMAVSSFKRERVFKTQPGTTDMTTPSETSSVPCVECKKLFYPFIHTSRGWNTKPYKFCQNCHKKRQAQRKSATNNGFHATESNNTAESFIQISTIESRDTKHQTNFGDVNLPTPHQTFTKGQWRRARFLNHPRTDVTLSVDKSDYIAFGRKCPNVKPQQISAISDSGAQTCLWSYNEFLLNGFTDDDLMPVTLDLMAANKSPIPIKGAVLIRLHGTSKNGHEYASACMVYISPAAKGFYLSLEVMFDLGIVSGTFPSIGSNEDHNFSENCCLEFRNKHAIDLGSSCTCPSRTAPPQRPGSLPFKCCPENNKVMEAWLLEQFSQSTFNTCPHQPLPCMDGPPVEIHIDKDATPIAVHKAAPVPIHWQDKVHSDLLRDEALGVIEKVPYGEAVKWCHRMVVTRKHDGTPRRTVDLSPLNKFCKRETFATESPFHLARRIPKGTWKTVCDAWNGYHSVPLREADRHLTSFITPFGRWRYKRAPQGFLSSGDGYNRRFDAILSDFERHERCVDDVIFYDNDLEQHWWRTIDLLILLAKSGIVLNPEKFSFARMEVDFAGFRLSDSIIEPLPKYLDAIRQFPTPKSTTDIRSWFGLINQVANYAQLRDIMAPFKPFLSPRHTFSWNSTLDRNFHASKEAIVDAICHGVSIFDPTKPTCLRPDWSKRGIGYFLLQKHCHCPVIEPECCSTGWMITLAGSRFLTSAEERYAPIEGEALAVAWGLEQSRYFTMGCPNLIVITDHRPLVKVLGDRTLDEITNTRLFRLKQRTLPWHFTIIYRPGATNQAADATSRNPNPTDYAVTSDDSPLLSSADIGEIRLIQSLKKDTHSEISVSWSDIVNATNTDPTLACLSKILEEGHQITTDLQNNEIISYVPYQNSLFVVEGVIIYNDRVVIPSSLRRIVLNILHSAHQGVSAMEARARSLIFWPGMTADIRETRNSCIQCNRSAPSQAKPLHIASSVPKTPFQHVFADFFEFQGQHYLVAGDRLSGWVEVFCAPNSTNLAGSVGLQRAFRSLFATFGVPEQLSSDGGPEFSSTSTQSFLQKWGIEHRVSSSYFPQSNGRAEVAVKKAKRLLMDNVSASGSLDNDKFLRALLQIRNTPDPDTNLSPAQILFGRPLRDAFLFINRCPLFSNRSIHQKWRDAWSRKEAYLLKRDKETSVALNAHSRQHKPIQAGVDVFIQNQFGPHPNKWDKRGKVIEAKDNDQYLVKVYGSGRLTTRNRRFLKPVPNHRDTNYDFDTHRRGLNARDMTKPSDGGTTVVSHSNSEQVDYLLPRTVPQPSSAADMPMPDQRDTPPTSPASPTHAQAPRVDQTETVQTQLLPEPLHTRPQRQRNPPRKYEPETGHWVDI